MCVVYVVANVTAPAVQYGVLHMPFRLHCEASSQFSSITTVKWINSTQNTITGSFSSVDFQDEGQYKCEIFIAAVNVRTTRMVELVVLSKLFSQSAETCQSRALVIYD